MMRVVPHRDHVAIRRIVVRGRRPMFSRSATCWSTGRCHQRSTHGDGRSWLRGSWAVS